MEVIRPRKYDSRAPKSLHDGSFIYSKYENFGTFVVSF